jgi:5'-nucleotidase
MRILLTNDDGIHAPGLAALERIAGALSDDVWVVAPELDQSGLSHSLSLNDPLRLREIAQKRFALRGTPSDCIIMAVRRILAEKKPDLVLSGVNSGQNVADDVTYSGTIAGAIEATLLGVPAIALSQAYPAGERGRIPYETSETHGPGIIRKLLAFGFPGSVLYNINFPNRAPDAVEGIRITSQGKFAHGLHVEERFDGRGNQYFWLAYRRGKGTLTPGTDIHAIGEGAISLTALRLDLTAHDLKEPLNHHFSRAE